MQQTTQLQVSPPVGASVLRSAIRDSQQLTSPIGFLFFTLPRPPCAVMLENIVNSICQFFPAGFDSDLTEGLVIVADLLVVCYYFPASLDPDLTETAVILAHLLVLSPYLSSSLDPDLTEVVVILAYLLVVCQYLPASCDPDLMEGVVILAAYLLVVYASTSQPVLIQIWPKVLWL